MFDFFKNTPGSKIQNRLVGYYVVFAVFTIVLITNLTYTQAAQSLRLTVEDKLDTVAALEEDSLTQWVGEQQSTAIFLASLPELRTLAGNLLNPDSSTRDQVLARAELTNLVTLIAQRTSDYKDIQILDLDGRVVISVSSRNVDASQADQPFFEEGQKKTFIQDFYESDLLGETTLTISTPLFDSNNKRVGVLALHFNMKKVDDILSNDRKLNENIRSYLVDTNRRVITNDPIVLSELPTLKSFAIDSALSGGEGSASYVNHTGMPVIGKYQWIEELDAALIVEINENTALLPARDLSFRVALIGILFSIALVIVVIIMARRITAPLLALTRTVTHISEGDLHASAPVLSDDEVGTLAQTFNIMTEKLRHTLAGLEKELHERQQAEDALRQSEERYRTLFEGMQDGVYRSTHEGRFIDVNMAMVKMFGYDSREEMLAIDIKKELYFSVEDRESLFLDTRQEKVEVFRMRRKDGSEIWVEDHGSYIHDPDGNVIYHEGILRDITERKWAEDALAESEKKLRMLAENTPVVVFQCRNDDHFTFIYLNDAVEELTGYPPKAFLEEGLSFFDIYHPEDVSLVMLPEDQLHLHKPSYHITYRIRHKSGEWRWVDEWGTYVANEADHVEYIVGMIIDITERKHAETALQQSEERFRKVFHSSPVAICITTLEDGRLLDANYAYWDLTGYNPEESLGRNAEELALWYDIDEREKFIRDLKQKRSIYKPDDYFHHIDGSLKNVISFYELIRLGREDCILAMFYDMSTQKQTMQALQQSEARVRALLEAIPDMIMELTRDGLITNMIPPKGMDASMPAGQFIGRRIQNILSEPGALQSIFSLESAVAAGHMTVFEFEEQMGNEKRTMEARFVPSSSNTALMMVRDITQRKWIETEREKLIYQLEIKNRESETLRESLASIVTIFDIEKVMERILDQIRHVIPYDTASVWRVEGEWQTMMIGRDLPPEISPESLKFKVDEDNSSRPILYGDKSFVLSNNVQEELSDFKGPHSYINSWLAVPLRTRGKVIGLIALDGRQKNQFNEHHAELAVTFADQVAIAFENAGLFANLQAELEKTRELIEELQVRNMEVETMRESLASIVGTFKFSEIIQRILDQIQLVVPYDSASIWRLDENRQILIGQRGLPSELAVGSLELELDEHNHALRIFNGELPYLISNDVQAASALSNFHKPPHTYINSWLGVPLKVRGNITGMIALDGKRKSQFNEHHAELAVTFADQVAIAIENADLFSSLQTELEERKALITELELKNIESETLRESAAIIASTLEKDETINRILDQLERVVPFDSASIQLVDGDMLVIVSEKGFSLDESIYEKRFEINEGELAYPVLYGAVPYVLFNDVQSESSKFAETPHDRIHAWMAVPLKLKGRVIGVIALDGYESGRFTERHAQLAVTFADQVSIALENARLFSNLQTELSARQVLIRELEQKNAEAETLRESTAIVAATLEISETVQRILEQIKRVVQYDSASVWLYQGENAFMMGSNGLPPGAELPGKYVIGENEPDYAFWRDKVPYILLDDIQEQYHDFRKPPKNYIRGWLTIPLRVRGKLTGFISLDSRTPGKFTEHDAELALTFANQVSIAIENARLFWDLQTELVARKDLIAELESKNAELERFTYTVSHDLKSPLFTIRGFLGYLEQDVLAGNHARMKSDMQRITDATEKMGQLLNELLELSRIGRLMNEQVNIPFEELAREAVDLVQGRIMDRGVAVHIDGNMPVVYGDHRRLLEVVQNLVDNAVKFMGDQTTPRIEIGWDGQEEGKPIFHVRDNGIGIPPEHHERIFGLFNKLDVKMDGTGIGLALVKRIVEVHGGRIWVQSAPSPKGEAGNGSTFFFTLPASTESESVEN